MTISVYTGPMCAAKSTQLIMEAKKAIESGKWIKAFKPSIDTRYGKSNITSHDGLDFTKETGQQVTIIDADKDSIFIHLCKLKSEWHLPDLILIDEAQFFPNLVQDIEDILELSQIDIVCCGLDCDSNGDPFGPMPELLAKANYVHKLKALCSICGDKAGKTFRKLSAPNQKILIGGSDLYEPRCDFHWKKGMDEKKNWMKKETS